MIYIASGAVLFLATLTALRSWRRKRSWARCFAAERKHPGDGVYPTDSRVSCEQAGLLLANYSRLNLQAQQQYLGGGGGGCAAPYSYVHQPMPEEMIWHAADGRAQPVTVTFT